MKKQNISIIALCCILMSMTYLFDSCVKEDTFIKATIETSQVTSITEATATCGGFISDDGGSDVTARGICWNTSPNPTVENDTTIDAAGTGPFTSVIKGLSPFKTYYVRAYATNRGGTAYGLQMTFTTKTLTFTTIPASFIMAESVISGGMISSDGDSLTILDRGVCWSMLPYPTITDSSTHDGRGKGSYTSTLIGLKPFTTYFARAYVTNSVGTTYGNDISFTTQNGIVGFTTEPATTITATTAFLSANITGDGGSLISECGFCYSTSTVPSLTNKKIFSGGNSGIISLSLSELTANTTYHVWTYGINNVDTTFSNEVIFKTKDGIIGLNTPAASLISASDATITSAITDDGGSQISECGFCWSTINKPSLANKKIYTGEKSGIISVELSELSANTNYYVWAYGINKIDTTYSDRIILTTRDGVTRFSDPVLSSNGTTTAIFNGAITDNAGSPVTECGFSWHSSLNPAEEFQQKATAINNGAFSCTLFGLTSETMYYVRAYAKNGVGISYSNEVSFTTEPETTGDGSLNNPFFVNQAISKQGETSPKWVFGYIVGSVKSGINAGNPINGNDDISWTSAHMNNTLVVAAKSQESNWSRCLVVNLPAGSAIRESANLVDNPTNFGRVLGVYGTFENYLGGAGVTVASGSAGEYWLDHQPVLVEGNGTQAQPYTVAQVKAKQNETAKWVSGYIVGYIYTTTSPYTYTYSATGAGSTNILIADSPTETVDGNCVPVQLPIGVIRDGLSLSTKPANLGKRVTLKGDLLAYFSVPGVKTLTAYTLEGETPVVEPTPIFSEAFSGTLGAFSPISVVGAQLWAGSSYGAIMNGYVNSTCNTNEDWLISPAINLIGKSSAVLSFMHTINKGLVANLSSNHTVWVSNNYYSGAPSTATWTKVSIPTYPGGADWTFVSSGNIALPATVLGNSNCRIAFKYLCSTTEASTWEIKSLNIVP